MFKFKNGDTLKCKVTGFSGVVTARCDYLTGCNRYMLQPHINEKEPAKLPEAVWFDEPQLEQEQVQRVTLARETDPPG